LLLQNETLFWKNRERSGLSVPAGAPKTGLCGNK
jgi:hypothetical protein